MEVIIFSSKSIVLEKIPIGECFEFKKSQYIKLDVWSENRDKYMVWNLNCKSMDYINRSETVVILESKVILSYLKEYLK